MDLYGLIGYPLEHSFSPDFFKEFFEKKGINASYQLFPLKDINELPDLIHQLQPNLKGLNVTIPYKTRVISYLDKISEEAEKIGAVNTVKIVGSELIGYNTDCYGFEKAYHPALLKIKQNAIILGTGATSKTVAYVLKKYAIPFYKVSRKPGKQKNGILNYKDLNKRILQQAKLIINTTPMGMYPNLNSSPPIDYSAIQSDHFLIDLIYNPPQTLFLKKGKKQGASVYNGKEMLIKQAEQAWKIWSQPASYNC